MRLRPNPILYSFRRCPYAMRARLAISVSGIPCELREVVLRDKPAEMLELSPKGTVPVLWTTEDIVIDESLDIMLWALNQSDLEGWLKPEHGNIEDALALIKKTEQEFKPHLDRYKYSNRYDGVSPFKHKLKAEEFLASLEADLSENAYLFGSKQCIADVAVLPFVRQFAFVNKDDFDENPYIHVQKWLARFLDSDRFAQVMSKTETRLN